MAQIFTIGNGQPPLVDKFSEDQVSQEQNLVETPGDNSKMVVNEYTRPLFKIYGFGVSHMYIDLASVILMSILVIMTLNSRFKK